MRFPFAALAVTLLTVLPLAAGDDGLTGNWKFSIFDQRGQQTLWLIRLDSKDGKLTASADVLKGAPRVKLEDIKLGGDTFTIKFRVSGGGPRDITFDYEGKLPKPGAKKILGSFSEGTVALPAIMEATTAKTAFDVDRDFVLRTPSDPRAMETILDLIEKARDNEMTGKDLQILVDGSLKAAEGYGPRFLTKHQLNVLNALRGQKKYADIAAEIASKVVKQLDAKQSLDTQLQILSTSADALRAGGKTGDAVALDGRIEKLEKQAYEDHAKSALNFKPEVFKIEPCWSSYSPALNARRASRPTWRSTAWRKPTSRAKSSYFSITCTSPAPIR
jgi:hypothetical protein